MPTLYQAEWCPFSSAVREVLTELGVDFVARQVEPWPKERDELRAVAGTDQIAVLQTEDGCLYRGTREIFAYLHEHDPWQFAAAHRRRFADHRDARESDASGQLVEYFPGNRRARVSGRSGYGDRGRRRAGGEPLRAAARRAPDRSRRLPASEWAHRLHTHRGGRIVRGPRFRQPPCRGRVGRRASGGRLEVVPLCPFIAHYVERHPEYEQLMASGYGDR
jgi:glutathione S-transferase